MPSERATPAPRVGRAACLSAKTKSTSASGMPTRKLKKPQSNAKPKTPGNAANDHHRFPPTSRMTKRVASGTPSKAAVMTAVSAALTDMNGVSRKVTRYPNRYGVNQFRA